jgi:transcriptional regulator of acetoin/glycerol metabolism
MFGYRAVLMTYTSASESAEPVRSHIGKLTAIVDVSKVQLTTQRVKSYTLLTLTHHKNFCKGNK